MESVEAPMEFVVEGYAAVFMAFVGAAPIIVERAFASPNAKVNGGKQVEIALQKLKGENRFSSPHIHV